MAILLSFRTSYNTLNNLERKSRDDRLDTSQVTLIADVFLNDESLSFANSDIIFSQSMIIQSIFTNDFPPLFITVEAATSNLD